MRQPPLQVMSIAIADPNLFESLMAKAGFKITARTNDPLNSQVQFEAISAMASAITEDIYSKPYLSQYHKQLKTLAERAGYVVENCGPPGADPCDGDMVPLDGVGESETLIAMGDIGPDVGNENSELEQIAAMPIGTELASAMMAVLRGEGPEAVSEFPEDEFAQDDEFAPEDNLEDEPPADESDEGDEFIK